MSKWFTQSSSTPPPHSETPAPPPHLTHTHTLVRAQTGTATVCFCYPLEPPGRKLWAKKKNQNHTNSATTEPFFIWSWRLHAIHLRQTGVSFKLRIVRISIVVVNFTLQYGIGKSIDHFNTVFNTSTVDDFSGVRKSSIDIVSTSYVKPLLYFSVLKYTTKRYLF